MQSRMKMTVNAMASDELESVIVTETCVTS